LPVRQQQRHQQQQRQQQQQPQRRYRHNSGTAASGVRAIRADGRGRAARGGRVSRERQRRRRRVRPELVHGTVRHGGGGKPIGRGLLRRGDGGPSAGQAAVAGRQRRRVQRDAGARDRVRRPDGRRLRAGLERHAPVVVAAGRRRRSVDVLGQVQRDGRRDVSDVPGAAYGGDRAGVSAVRPAAGHVEGRRVDCVHADRVGGGRDMRRVHSVVHTGASMQEGCDGGQSNVHVRAGGRHAAHVRQRRAVRGVGQRRRLAAAGRVLRQAVRFVGQLRVRVLRNAGPEHDDRCVRLRLELHESRERLPADVPVCVHRGRAAGAHDPVRGHTRGRRAVVRPVPGVRRRSPVPGHHVLRRVAAGAPVRHVPLRVPVEAQLPGGRVLRHRHLPGVRRLAVLGRGVRVASRTVVRHVRDGRPDGDRDRERGHRVHTAHVHDDVRHCPRTDHQLAAVTRLRSRWRRRQRHGRQL